MRASSLSNAKVIDLLNGYFVCVHACNQDYSEHGSAPAQEKAAKDRIYREALQAGLPAGTVCAYLLTPAGRPVDTAPLNRPEATDPERMAAKLARVVADLKVAKGDPVVRPTPQSAPRDAEADSLVLHLTARYLQRKGDDLVRIDTQSVLGSQKGGNWGDLPSEDWIALGRAEWSKLLPTGDIQAGAAWELDRQVAAKLLKHFFPPTENTAFEKNRIDEQSLRARVDSVQDGVARATLEGRLKMKHPFYHKDDNNFVEARLVGYLEFEAGKEKIRSLRLVTDNATYGGNGNGRQFFGVAVRSVAGRRCLVGAADSAAAAGDKSGEKGVGQIVFYLDGPDQVVDRRVATFSFRDKVIHQLTDRLPFRFQPEIGLAVSRDGKTAAYLADGTAPPEGGLVTFTIFLRSLDDRKGNGRDLGLKAHGINAWRPDGKQLLFMTYDSTNAVAHHLVDLSTSKTTDLSLPKFEAPADAAYPSGHSVTDWSPDGSWFLTNCTYAKKSGQLQAYLFLVKSDGSEARRLEHIEFGLGAKFSPDGRRILFTGRYEVGGKQVDQLFVADLAAGKSVRVSQELNGSPPRDYCWSPDGKRVAYVWHNRQGGNDDETFLMVVDADGRNATVLTSQKSRGYPRFASVNWR